MYDFTFVQCYSSSGNYVEKMKTQELLFLIFLLQQIPQNVSFLMEQPIFI
jgi:hypothetical protein